MTPKEEERYILKHIDRSELLWERLYENDRLKFVITSDKMRQNYYIYKVGSPFTKIGRARDPIGLHKKYFQFL